MSAARTGKDHVLLRDAIYATQLTVCPEGTEHTADEVGMKMQSMRRTRYCYRQDMEFLLSFLEKGSMTVEHCERMAKLLIAKHGFPLRTPVDPQALEMLRSSEFESYKAQEALQDAQNEVDRTYTQVQDILVCINES
jgi:hypothetical protein